MVQAWGSETDTAAPGPAAPPPLPPRSELFFLPLHNPDAGLANMPVADFVQSHVLERAAVSDAARRHVRRLRDRGVLPQDWRDAWSQPVLAVAVRNNYVALAAWLLEQGVPLSRDGPGLALLEHSRAHNMPAMEQVLGSALRAHA